MFYKYYILFLGIITIIVIVFLLFIYYYIIFILYLLCFTVFYKYSVLCYWVSSLLLLLSYYYYYNYHHYYHPCFKQKTPWKINSFWDCFFTPPVPVRSLCPQMKFGTNLENLKSKQANPFKLQSDCCCCFLVFFI